MFKMNTSNLAVYSIIKSDDISPNVLDLAGRVKKFELISEWSGWNRVHAMTSITMRKTLQPGENVIKLQRRSTVHLPPRFSRPHARRACSSNPVIPHCSLSCMGPNRLECYIA